MLELHEEYSISLRGFKCHDVLFKVSDRLLRRQLVLYADQRKGFRDVEKSERRAGEDEELGRVGVKFHLRMKAVETLLRIEERSLLRRTSFKMKLSFDDVEFPIRMPLRGEVESSAGFSFGGLSSSAKTAFNLS